MMFIEASIFKDGRGEAAPRPVHLSVMSIKGLIDHDRPVTYPTENYGNTPDTTEPVVAILTTDALDINPTEYYYFISGKTRQEVADMLTCKINASNAFSITPAIEKVTS